jgi:hypothetical protein
MLPGLQDLLENVKELEDHFKANRSGEARRIFPITLEEEEVIRSFRRFMAQDSD